MTSLRKNNLSASLFRRELTGNFGELKEFKNKQLLRSLIEGRISKIKPTLIDCNLDTHPFTKHFIEEVINTHNYANRYRNIPFALCSRGFPFVIFIRLIYYEDLKLFKFSEIFILNHDYRFERQYLFKMIFKDKKITIDNSKNTNNVNNFWFICYILSAYEVVRDLITETLKDIRRTDIKVEKYSYNKNIYNNDLIKKMYIDAYNNLPQKGKEMLDTQYIVRKSRSRSNRSSSNA